MSDCWEYKRQKVKIAWKLAQKGIDRLKEKHYSSQDKYHEAVQQEVQKAWDIIDGIFPSHESRE